MKFIVWNHTPSTPSRILAAVKPRLQQNETDLAWLKNATDLFRRNQSHILFTGTVRKYYSYREAPTTWAQSRMEIGLHRKLPHFAKRSNIYSNSSTKARSKCLSVSGWKQTRALRVLTPFLWFRPRFTNTQTSWGEGLLWLTFRANIFHVHDNSTTMTSFHEPCWEQFSGERGELLPVPFGTGKSRQLKNARSQHEVTQECDNSFTARLMLRFSQLPRFQIEEES